MNRHFTYEEMRMASQHVEASATWPVIGKTQCKSVRDLFLILYWWKLSLLVPSAGKDMEPQNPCCWQGMFCTVTLENNLALASKFGCPQHSNFTPRKYTLFRSGFQTDCKSLMSHETSLKNWDQIFLNLNIREHMSKRISIVSWNGHFSCVSWVGCLTMCRDVKFISYSESW